MAEQPPKTQSNAWQLIVAIGLGVLVVILYNVHQARIRRAHRGEMINVLVYRQNLRAGDQLTHKALDEVELSKTAAERLQNVVQDDERNFLVTQTLISDVYKGNYVEWSHISGSEAARPSAGISETLYRISLPIEGVTSPGADMRPGDRINLLGTFVLGQAGPRRSG